MNPSANCRSLVQRFEGCKLQAYPDPATGGKPYTIGYGRTDGVQLGDTITQDEAEAFLDQDLAEATARISPWVTFACNQNQVDALVSIVFNVGPGAPGVKDGIVWLKAMNQDGSRRHSTLLNKLNAGDVEGCANEFPKWDRAAGREMAGLLNRRQAERELFLQPMEPDPA